MAASPFGRCCCTGSSVSLGTWLVPCSDVNYCWVDVFGNAAYRTQVINFVTAKQVKPAFHQIFLREIGCNWLVCPGLLSWDAGQGSQCQSGGDVVANPHFRDTWIRSRGRQHVLHSPGTVARHTGLTVELYIWKGNVKQSLNGKSATSRGESAM